MNCLNSARPPLLELRSVSFSWNGARRALDNVSLEVRRGERVAVLGHNGSGKSTLVKIVGALQTPLQGACFFAGRDVREIPFRKLHSLVGVVFQDPENQLVGAVLEDDVAFAPENQGLPPAEIQARVDWALEKVGLLHKRRAMVSALSGGEKQRAALAGALAAQVECLILDEPTSMLDPEGRLDVAEVLRTIHASGTTILQVTHQLENFDDVDRVLVLKGGRLAWQGSVDDFWGHAEALGFDLPPIHRLAGRLGLDHGGRVTLERVASRLAELCPRLPPPEQAAADVSAPSRPFIEVRGLSFRFEDAAQPEMGGAAALTDVDAEFPAGGWLSIVGRTGSGKSTLAQHLNGLYRIQSGSITLLGSPLPQKGEELHALRRRVGLVFQNPETQLFSPTVREELAFAPANAGVEGQELQDSILYALEAVGLGQDFLERNPIALSGGERRLVAIASVLAARPECLVLDEPLAGLDAEGRRRILELLKGLRGEGRTLVTITHDLDMALRFSDRILVMDGGRSAVCAASRQALPTLMKVLRPGVWPDALRLSQDLRRRWPAVPLTWDVQELFDTFQTLLPMPMPAHPEGGV